MHFQTLASRCGVQESNYLFPYAPWFLWMLNAPPPFVWGTIQIRLESTIHQTCDLIRPLPLRSRHAESHGLSELVLQRIRVNLVGEPCRGQHYRWCRRLFPQDWFNVGQVLGWHQRIHSFVTGQYLIWAIPAALARQAHGQTSTRRQFLIVCT